MYEVKVNKTIIQNHIRYDWWKYALAILATVIIWNGVTNYKINKAIPEDERMEVFLVGDYIYNDTTEKTSNKILESMEDLQKLDFINIPMNTLEEQKKQLEGMDPENKSEEEPDEESGQNIHSLDPQLDMAGQQKLMVMMGSQSGDIFIFETERYKLYAKQGAFMPLEGYVDEIKDVLTDEEVLETLKVKAEDDDESRLYALPADSIEAFEGTGYDMEDKVLCIMAYSKKPEKAWKVAKWLLEGNK